MRPNPFAAAVLFILFPLCISALASDGEPAGRAVSEDPLEASAAVAELRRMGPEGLELLLEKHAEAIEAYKKTGRRTAGWDRLAAAIDAVAMQKDAYASRLYWHTDLDAARAAAARTGRPLLSLRLLGNLNEEYSCANSRFFRSTLYANAAVSRYMRENFVLHWRSVRPAPKVTVDFGDGRKIERTLTGNSIHYVLDPEGRVIDALPGLNAPDRFFSFLSASAALHGSISSDKDPDMRAESLRQFRVTGYRQLTRKIDRTARRLGLEFDVTAEPSREFEEMPPALLASEVAVTKSMIEISLLRDMTPDVIRYGSDQIDLRQWRKIAAETRVRSDLDAASVAFIRRQTARNGLTEQQFARLIGNLGEYIAVDTARNEFLLRPILLVWLTKDPDADIEKLNERIYAELFLTPGEDRWLGLYAPDLYTALEGSGVTDGRDR